MRSTASGSSRCCRRRSNPCRPCLPAGPPHGARAPLVDEAAGWLAAARGDRSAAARSLAIDYVRPTTAELAALPVAGLAAHVPGPRARRPLPRRARQPGHHDRRPARPAPRPRRRCAARPSSSGATASTTWSRRDGCVGGRRGGRGTRRAAHAQPGRRGRGPARPGRARGLPVAGVDRAGRRAEPAARGDGAVRCTVCAAFAALVPGPALTALAADVGLARPPARCDAPATPTTVRPTRRRSPPTTAAPPAAADATAAPRPTTTIPPVDVVPYLSVARPRRLDADAGRAGADRHLAGDAGAPCRGTRRRAALCAPCRSLRRRSSAGAGSATAVTVRDIDPAPRQAPGFGDCLIGDGGTRRWSHGTYQFVADGCRRRHVGGGDARGRCRPAHGPLRQQRDGPGLPAPRVAPHGRPVRGVHPRPGARPGRGDRRSCSPPSSRRWASSSARPSPSSATAGPTGRSRSSRTPPTISRSSPPPDRLGRVVAGVCRPAAAPEQSEPVSRPVGAPMAHHANERRPSTATLDALLAENRKFPPPERIDGRRPRHRHRPVRRGGRRRRGLLGPPGRRAARLDAGVDHDPRLAAAVRQVVRRRPAQRRRQLPRPPRRGRPRRPGRDPLRGRAGRHPHDHLRRPAGRGRSASPTC